MASLKWVMGGSVMGAAGAGGGGVRYSGNGDSAGMGR